MSLKLDLSKEQLWIGKLLAKGQVEFDELDFERKLIMYEANVDISDVVPQEQIQDFEDKLALKNYFGPKEMAKSAARQARKRIA